MNKKIAFFIIYLFLQSCGFQPLLKDYDISNINFKKINYTGENSIVYLLKNNLNISENLDNNDLTSDIFISESITDINKNTSGIVTEQELKLNVTIKVFNKNNQNILNENILGTRRISITNNPSSDDEVKKQEKNNIIRELAQKIKFKFYLISSKK